MTTIKYMMKDSKRKYVERNKWCYNQLDFSMINYNCNMTVRIDHINMRKTTCSWQNIFYYLTKTLSSLRCFLIPPSFKIAHVASNDFSSAPPPTIDEMLENAEFVTTSVCGVPWKSGWIKLFNSTFYVFSCVEILVCACTFYNERR